MLQAPHSDHIAADVLDLIVVLSQVSDEKAILEIIAKSIGSQHPYVVALGYLNIDEQTNQLTVEAVATVKTGFSSAGSTPTLLLPSPIAMEHGTDFVPNAPVTIKDFTALSPKEKSLAAILATPEIQTALLLPLHANSRWQAVLAIGWLEAYSFTDQESLFYQALIRPLAGIIASRRVHLAEETARQISEQRARELETVTKVSAIVASILDLDDLLQTVCDLTNTNFNLYHVNIYLLSDDGQNMVLAAGAGAIGRQMKSHRYSVPINRQRSLLALAVQTREVVMVDDVTRSPDFLPNPYLPHTRSEMVIPIIIGAALIGALVVQARQIKRFEAKDIPVMTALSDQIGVAVQNARLFTKQEQVLEELRALDKLKSQFMANMSHELRTPLNSILNFTEFVASGIFGPVNAKQVDSLNKAISSGEHLLALINDILDLTKIESGMMELFIEEVDLRAMVKDVSSLAEGLLKNKSVQFICQLDDSLQTLTGDRRRIQQILLNLVSNAIKFTAEGSIILKSVIEETQVHFSVRDTGTGIAPGDQEMIFQAFRQTKQGLQKGSGTGLGLPISKHLAEAHGGHLWLESEIGVGSCFHVLLPIEHQPVSVDV